MSVARNNRGWLCSVCTLKVNCKLMAYLRFEADFSLLYFHFYANIQCSNLARQSSIFVVLYVLGHLPAVQLEPLQFVSIHFFNANFNYKNINIIYKKNLRLCRVDGLYRLNF
jgi:hypothetical protein